jgi:hypothetical protein
MLLMLKDPTSQEAELERCLSRPEEPTAEASMPSNSVVTTEVVRVNPEEPATEVVEV